MEPFTELKTSWASRVPSIISHLKTDAVSLIPFGRQNESTRATNIPLVPGERDPGKALSQE